jgi:hypothetical protein
MCFVWSLLIAFPFAAIALAGIVIVLVICSIEVAITCVRIKHDYNSFLAKNFKKFGKNMCGLNTLRMSILFSLNHKPEWSRTFIVTNNLTKKNVS